MKKRKILYISGSRADYGLAKETLLALEKTPKLKVEILACGMHLMPEFGETIKEIIDDGFRVRKINAVYEKDDKEAVVGFIGEFISGFLKKIKEIKPDLIFVQGDRAEMLGAAIVGNYLGIPVVHSHGGEVTSTVDEIARHAITKLSQIHFAATKKSAQRIIKMGEDPWRVFAVGALGLDAILNKKLCSRKEIAKKYKLDLSKPILLVLQHPVTAEINDARWQMEETMGAIKDLEIQAVVIYPSADPGGRKMIKVIKKYEKYPLIKGFKNIPHKNYLSLMGVANAMVGNSSSGIIEAPSFHLPAVNIGSRQQGRERTINVIDVDYDKEKIKKAIKTAIGNKIFRGKVKRCRNPYGDGRAGKRITDIFSKIKIDKKLLQKQITY